MIDDFESPVPAILEIPTKVRYRPNQRSGPPPSPSHSRTPLPNLRASPAWHRPWIHGDAGHSAVQSKPYDADNDPIYQKVRRMAGGAD